MDKYLLAGENEFTCGRKFCYLREKNYLLAGENFAACGRKRNSQFSILNFQFSILNSNHPQFLRVLQQLRRIVRIKFDVQFLAVVSDGILSEEHLIGLFGQRFSFGDELQQFLFAGSEFQQMTLGFSDGYIRFFAQKTPARCHRANTHRFYQLHCGNDRRQMRGD